MSATSNMMAQINAIQERHVIENPRLLSEAFFANTKAGRRFLVKRCKELGVDLEGAILTHFDRHQKFIDLMSKKGTVMVSSKPMRVPMRLKA